MAKKLTAVLRFLFAVSTLGGIAWSGTLSYSGHPAESLSVAMIAGVIVLAWLIAELSLFPYLSTEEEKYDGARITFAALCFGLLVATGVAQAPLRYAFNKAKPDLEKTAGKLRSGSNLAFPQEAGNFEVKDIDGDTTGKYGLRLIVNPETGGFCHFPSGIVRGFEPTTALDLGDGWYYLEGKEKTRETKPASGMLTASTGPASTTKSRLKSPFNAALKSVRPIR